MARKTGKNVRVEFEIGSTPYPWNALTSVTSPTANVGKKFPTSATYMSDDIDRQVDVRLDGAVSGFVITAYTDFNSVEVSAGVGYLKGASLSVTASIVADIERPTSAAANVLWTALSVDTDGDINKTVGTEGAPTDTRGAAGGPPFIPADEFLIGYITASYYTGSVSGGRVITASEINSDTKEYANIPGYNVIHHDGSGSNPENTGVIEFKSQLELIHGAGAGTARRNVYAEYFGVVWEEAPDAYDFNPAEDTSVVESRAYQDQGITKIPDIDSWTVGGTAYTNNDPNDYWSLLKGKTRWYRQFPDADLTGYFAGVGVVTVARNMPVADTMNAAITVNGSGKLYNKTS